MNEALIIGTPDAQSLKKRMDQFETQMSALLDGMDALGKAVESAADLVDAHEKKLDAILESLHYAPDDAEVIHLSRAVKHRLDAE